MSPSYEKTLRAVMSGGSDTNIEFDSIRTMLRAMGFAERVSGSHHLFRRPDVTERINLQPDGSKAKSYQVRQLRAILASRATEKDL